MKMLPLTVAFSSYTLPNFLDQYWYYFLGGLVIIAGLVYLLAPKFWSRYELQQNTVGEPVPPLEFVVKQKLRLAYIEDKTPVFFSNKVGNYVFNAFTWQKFWVIDTILLLLAFSSLFFAPAPVSTVSLLVLLVVTFAAQKHVNSIVTFQRLLLSQHFKAAKEELGYTSGAELNPWGYIHFAEWSGIYSPAVAHVFYPSEFDASSEKSRTSFEERFSNVVDAEYVKEYVWQPDNSRVEVIFS